MKNLLTGKRIMMFVALVIALAVAETFGVGPIGLAGRFNAWRASRQGVTS